MNLITNVFRLVHFRARHHKILRGFGHRDRIILKVLLESACSTRRVTCFLRVLYAGALQNHDIMEMVALHQIPNLERRRVQPLIFPVGQGHTWCETLWPRETASSVGSPSNKAK